MTMTLAGGEAFAEDTWIGHDIAIGAVVLAVREPCERCVATTRDPRTGEKDLPLLRAMKAVRIQAQGEYITEIDLSIDLSFIQGVGCEGCCLC